MNILENPIMHVNDMWLRAPEGVELLFKFATYERPGDGNHDKATYVRGSVLIPTMARMAAGLTLPNAEIGISSRVEQLQNGMRNNMHIPMIDFDRDCVIHHASWACDMLEKETGVKLSLYRTGNSFHAYGDRLLDEHEWLIWNAKLLLVDPADSFVVAPDHRWIGFSLTRGESFLRLSHHAPISGAIHKTDRVDASQWQVTESQPYSRSESAPIQALTAELEPFGQYHGEPPKPKPSPFSY